MGFQAERDPAKLRISESKASALRLICSAEWKMSDITESLEGVQRGDPNAAAALMPLVYDELRRLAVHKMAQERPGQTLQPTALVHEAWLRLRESNRQEWRGREHFFSAAAEAMRRILVD